ncbi:PDZ and LIM domain protein Zasp-like isoform X4 [Eriocheir sinensis]|uniref:PDZ and LIM domain protein Zasp-like isoform X4 n=1 Tax=Eriocheir sinensis TaxID=95602 RepID=UPI0021C7B6CF|nr:PDZ and LIM domain protein Zasp-like isoform X4 [Eriocheir sinensis]
MSIMTIKLSRSEGTPWGFRLQGGKDFATPLCVQKVNAGSVAAVAGLQAGDAIVSIGGKDALSLRHKEAQEAIVRAGNIFDVVIQRGAQTWRPQVTPLAQVKTTPEGVPVATSTSLAANKKPVRHIGSNHNTVARPFPGFTGATPTYSSGSTIIRSPLSNSSEEVACSSLSGTSSRSTSGSTSPSGLQQTASPNISLNKEIAKNFLRMTLDKENVNTVNVHQTSRGGSSISTKSSNSSSSENLFSGAFSPASGPAHQRKYSLASNASSSSSEADHDALTRRNNEVNGQQIVNAQYNTPLNLYSEDNIAETLSAQAEVLGKGCLGINFKKYDREAVIQTESPTYKLIHGDLDDAPKSRPPPKLPFIEAEPPSEFPRLKPAATRPAMPAAHPAPPQQGYYNINEKLYCDVHAKQAARHHPPGPNLDPIIVKPGATAPAGAIHAPFAKTAAPFKPPVGSVRIMPSVPAPAPRPIPKFSPIAPPKPEPVVAAPEPPPAPEPQPVLPPEPEVVAAPEPEPVPAQPEPVVTPPPPPPVMSPPPAPAPVPEQEVEVAPAPTLIEAQPELMFQPEPEAEPEPEPEPEPAPEAPATEAPAEETPLQPPTDQEPDPQTSEAITEPQPEINGSVLPESELTGAVEPADQPTEVTTEAEEAPQAAQEPEVVPESQAEPQPEITEVAEAVPLLAPEPAIAPEAQVPPQSSEPSEPTVEESPGAPVSEPEPTSGASEATSVPVSEPAPILAPAPAPIQVPAAPMAAPPPIFSPVKAPAAPAPQKAPFGAPAGGVDVRSHIPKKAPAPKPPAAAFASVPKPAAPKPPAPTGPAPVFAPAPAPELPKPSPLPNLGGAPMKGVAQTSGQKPAPRRGRGVMNPSNTARIPICADCNRQIRGPFVSALGKTWCPDHFVCSTASCRKALIDMGFVEEQGALHCEDCYEKYLAPICGKCDKRVKGDCLNAVGKQFHPECFCCAYCGKVFGSGAFYLEDGLPYCETDWNDLFTTKCVGCGFPIEAGDRWVEALNNNYHSQCFKCSKCHKNLEGQSFFAKGGKPFCKAHAQRGL